MELEVLVREVSPWLVAAAPYLTQLRDSVSEGLIKNVSEEAVTKLNASFWDNAKTIWNKLLGSEAETKPALIEAVKDVAEMPDYEPARSALSVKLLKLLKEDAALRSEIEKIINDINNPAGGNTARGDGNVFSEVKNVHDSNVSVGTGNITGTNISVNKREGD